MPTTNLFDHTADAKPFPAGATIFSTGDPRDVMYAVVEGEVDIIVNGKVVETVGKGGIFGEMALIEHQDRTATAITKTDTKLAVVDERRFLVLIGSCGSPRRRRSSNPRLSRTFSALELRLFYA